METIKRRNLGQNRANESRKKSRAESDEIKSRQEQKREEIADHQHSEEREK